jgi:hypothetical protein
LGPDVFAIPRGPPSATSTTPYSNTSHTSSSSSSSIKVERHPKSALPALLLLPTTTTTPSSSLTIDGVFGFFDLPHGGPYLAVITESEERYRGHGMEFRLVTKVTLVRVSNSSNGFGREGEGGRRRGGGVPSTAAMLGDEEEGKEGEGEEDEDAKQLELLRMAFRAHDLYFSPSCDVTLSAQRRATLGVFCGLCVVLWWGVCWGVLRMGMGVWMRMRRATLGAFCFAVGVLYCVMLWMDGWMDGCGMCGWYMYAYKVQRSQPPPGAPFLQCRLFTHTTSLYLHHPHTSTSTDSNPSSASSSSTSAPRRPRLTPLWQRADDRFFWNKNLLGPLVRALKTLEWIALDCV